MKKQQVRDSIAVILTFLIAVYFRRIVGDPEAASYWPRPLQLAYMYAWYVLPPLAFVAIRWSPGYIPECLGLNKHFLRSLGIAAICTAPMLIGSALLGEWRSDLQTENVLRSTILAGSMEEFLYRGFLFGMLFRFFRWGFVPAALLGAVFFAMGHLYQGKAMGDTMGVFLVTALGAAWFSWLYIEWNNSLWLPIFLHIGMNLAWTLFDVSHNALGGAGPNVFRAMTIGLSVFLTYRHRLPLGGLRLRAKNLWWQST